ncbi:MAG: orotate phosphoribosyltransferase [Candidatus Aenigmarchaeota archaeon]|nr:orotate phosphoribosyltransferase [Candidatus Aenigmarchaeota archaeon]
MIKEGLCQICGKPGIMNSCNLCGRLVCSECYNAEKGLCKICVAKFK